MKNINCIYRRLTKLSQKKFHTPRQIDDIMDQVLNLTKKPYNKAFNKLYNQLVHPKASPNIQTVKYADQQAEKNIKSGIKHENDELAVGQAVPSTWGDEMEQCLSSIHQKWCYCGVGCEDLYWAGSADPLNKNILLDLISDLKCNTRILAKKHNIKVAQDRTLKRVKPQIKALKHKNLKVNVKPNKSSLVIRIKY